MEVKAVVNVPGIHVRHIIVVIRRYSSCWLERSPPMATDIYKSTTRHAFVVSSFVELPPGARHRCRPWKSWPVVRPRKKPGMDKTNVLVPVALEGRRQSDAAKHALQVKCYRA